MRISDWSSDVCSSDLKELFQAKWPQRGVTDSVMKSMSAREAKNAFGLMIDTARAEPVRIEKHGRGVVVVVSVEEYERLCAQKERTDETAAGVGGEDRKSTRLNSSP